MDLLRGKRPRKDIETVESTESTNSLLYAGEGEIRDRFSEIVKFKLTGSFPDNLTNIADKRIKNIKIKDFLITAHNYVLTEEEISPLSKSKLCKKDEKNSSLLVIPFNIEIPSIIRALHFQNKVHFTRDYTIDRAKIYKVKWPGFCPQIKAYIKSCKCKCT